MATGTVFKKSLPLSYLGLPEDYEPSPQNAPIPFLIKHLTQLPPHLLLHFSHITSAKERTVITTIRNRRLKYITNGPPDLDFDSAKSRWPTLWQGRERQGIKQGTEEKEWAENEFIGGARKHVGKLSELLGGYEEDREAERVRTLRRQHVEDQFIPEEEDSSQSDEGSIEDDIIEETPIEARTSFERLIRERFIYGLLESFEYDKVDWDDFLDEEGEREAEERWFDEDE